MVITCELLPGKVVLAGEVVVVVVGAAVDGTVTIVVTVDVIGIVVVVEGVVVEVPVITSQLY